MAATSIALEAVIGGAEGLVDFLRDNEGEGGTWLYHGEATALGGQHLVGLVTRRA